MRILRAIGFAPLTFVECASLAPVQAADAAHIMLAAMPPR